MIQKPRYINTGGRLLDLSIPKIMGILNVTPDSFYSGSRYYTDKEVLKAAVSMIEEGADILDIGGYSSRPGAADISEKEEGRRVLQAIKIVVKELPEAVVSVDTFRASIANEAVLGCGAQIINDISGGEADRDMFSVVGKLNVPYVMMHMRGNSRTMQDNLIYDDIVADILRWFGERIYRLQEAGVKDIILDPGLGFSKSVRQNFELLRRLSDFAIAGLPVLVGVSRKSMIWKTLNLTAGEALNGTTVLNTVAIMNGADILRVHDVKEAVETVKLLREIRNNF